MKSGWFSISRQFEAIVDEIRKIQRCRFRERDFRQPDIVKHPSEPKTQNWFQGRRFKVRHPLRKKTVFGRA